MEILLRRPVTRYVCTRCSLQTRRTIRRTFASSANPDIYDVVCVGGGPAGLSLLTALRKSALCTLLVGKAFLFCSLRNLCRCESGHSGASSSPNRSTGSVKNAAVEITPRPIFEPMQLPNTDFCCISRKSGGVAALATR